MFAFVGADRTGADFHADSLIHHAPRLLVVECLPEFAFLGGSLAFVAVAVVAFFARTTDGPFDVAVTVWFVDSSEHSRHDCSPA